MKRVYFTIKANGTHYYHFMDVEAKNAKEACSIVKSKVFQSTGRNAFTPFCAPRNPGKCDIAIMERSTEF